MSSTTCRRPLTLCETSPMLGQHHEQAPQRVKKQPDESTTHQPSPIRSSTILYCWPKIKSKNSSVQSVNPPPVDQKRPGCQRVIPTPQYRGQSVSCAGDAALADGQGCGVPKRCWTSESVAQSYTSCSLSPLSAAMARSRQCTSFRAMYLSFSALSPVQSG